MHFQRPNNYQFQRQNFMAHTYTNRFPRQNRNNIGVNYQNRRRTNRYPEMNNMEENQMEMSNEGTYQNNVYQPHNIIRTIKQNINENYDPSQLVGNQNLSYAIHNYQSGFNEERTPSPKTINVGDTKENNVYNIRALNPRKSPNINNQFNQTQEMRYIEPNDYEVRNGSFDRRRLYTENDSFNDRDQNLMFGRNNDNNNSPNLIGLNGLFLGNLYNGPNSGGRVSLGELQSNYLQNYDEVNSSNENIRTGSEDRRNQTYYGNMNNEIRTDFLENMNNVPNQPMNMNNFNNYNNMNMMNNTANMNMTHYPQNTTILPQDEIQEKYENRTYDNMVYRDVKRIVRRFTKVYDPNKNNNGLLVHECQITVPGADDEIFNNRYRVLAKMGRLSSILLSKQKRNSPQKNEEEYIYNSDEMSSGDEPNIRPIKKHYRRKTFNRQSFEKRAGSPLVLANRKSPENKFKYVSLAMISSKGLKTENRTILRKMRFEKGGVVDLAAEDRRRGKYKIRKVSRSPGYKHNFFKTNPRYRIKAAKYIQDWWKKLKENNNNRIKKIIKIQSVYRGRFVRKYLYDLLYLNYLYLSFCQKIEKVLKQKIKPYVFDILKNYGKKDTDVLYDLLRNIIASKAKKWKIINKKRCFDKWKKAIRDREKLILLIYKMMKKRAEKQSRKSILKEALRKWIYVVNSLRSKEEYEKEKEIIIKSSKDHINKIKGLLKIVDGVSKYTKKSALEPTLPKLIQYLSKEYLNTLLRRIIQRKELDKKEILRKYFFKYIKMTLKYIKSHINENVKDAEMETEEDLKKEEFSMKRRIFLHLARSVKNKQNKNILGKYFTKYFKKIIKLQREEDRKKFEEQQEEENRKRNEEREKERLRELERQKERELEKERERQRERERKEEMERERQREKERKEEKDKEKQREKDLNNEKEKVKKLETEVEKGKNEIEKLKDEINKFDENKIIDKANKDLMDKLKACELLQRYIFRKTHKYPLQAFKEKLTKLRKNYLLIKILKMKENVKKYILKKYFDKWANKTFDKYKRDTIRKIFVKILSIIIDNLMKRLLQKKLYQWKKNTTVVREEPTIYNTLKIIKDIINFNDYLRNLSINKYGKNFINNLSKTRNPKLLIKRLKKIVRNKIKNNKNILRNALNKWKNKVEVEKLLKFLKTKLIYTLYDKNKSENKTNALAKYFYRWKNINTIEKIKEDISNIKHESKEIKTVIVKTIVKNKDKSKKKDTLKKYLNKWIAVVKNDKPLLKELFKKIVKINTLKNGKQFLDNLKTKGNYNKRRTLLLKAIPKRTKNEKILLYKYLLRWRNKIYGYKDINTQFSYGLKILSIILNKNDKQLILKAFNKWRFGKGQKAPINAYLVAIKTIRDVICKKPFKKFVDKMDKTNPKKLKKKGKKLGNILNKIAKEKPFLKLINNMKLLIRVNKLKNIQPKVHDTIKKYYLKKYLNIWKRNTDKLRKKNMKIISKWLRRKYDIEKNKKDKRKKELLKRIINNIIKDNKYKLKFPLHFWKRITNIYTDNDNARIIQNFCRKILLRKQRKKLDDQKKLTNLIIKLYKKTILKKMTDKDDVGKVNKYINTKIDNNKKLIKIFKKRDKNNDKLLLRLALLKWNEGKPKYDKSINIIQKKIRKFLSKKKLNNIKLLQNILKHIIKNNENKDKTYLRNKFLQWYAIAKKLNYHDTSKIEEFIRKIVVDRLRRKLQTTLNRYTYKYITYIIKNLARLNKLKNILRKKPTKDALDKIRNYIRNKNIKNKLDNIVKDKDDHSKILLLKKYFDKWHDKVKKIKDKETKSIIIIQKIFRGKKVKKNVNKEIDIKKILKNIVLRYSNNSPLSLYFAKWKRITRRIICDENAKIIQDFCRKIHDKYLKIKLEKNKKAYNKLSEVLTKLGKKPKRVAFDKFYNFYKYKILSKLVNDLDNKRKNILREVFGKINNSKKSNTLRRLLNLRPNLRKRIMRKYFNIWRNKALSHKLIAAHLTRFINRKTKKTKDLLRSVLYTWLYKAHLKLVKYKEQVIGEFCKKVANRIHIVKKWRELSDKLRNRKRRNDINDIYKKLRTIIGIKIITKRARNNSYRDFIDKLQKKKTKSTFVEKIKIIIKKVNTSTNDVSLKKYFDIWRNNTKRMNDRLNKLKLLMTILGIKQAKDDTNTIYKVMLIKKLFKDIPKFYLINALRRIKDFADNKNRNKKLANDLILSKKDIKNKKISPLIKKICKIYTYKVLDNLFGGLQKVLKRRARPSKYLFIEKLRQFQDKDYKYSHKIQKENKPYTKKIAFKSKKKVHPKTTQDKSKLYLTVISPLVKLIDDLIKKNKKQTFDKIRKKYIAEKMAKALRDYVYSKEKPNFEDFIYKLKILIDMYEHNGPQKAKLFKLLRKIVIKKLFVYKKEIYRINKIFYLLNLTVFNQEVAKNRWIRQLIRKWRFISFAKKMAKKKMELMYKNLHCSYLEMVNTIFSEESPNPSVIKEFERFGNGVGMFVNESPYVPREGNLCLGVKKKYLFQPVDSEKLFEIKKKVVSKEVVSEEKIVEKEIGKKSEVQAMKSTSKEIKEKSGTSGYKYEVSSSSKGGELKGSNSYRASSSGKEGKIKESEIAALSTDKVEKKKSGSKSKSKSRSKSKSKSKSKLQGNYSTKPLEEENKEKEKEKSKLKDNKKEDEKEKEKEKIKGKDIKKEEEEEEEEDDEEYEEEEDEKAE